VLLRKLADQAGLTAALGSALARKGKFPLVDRGVALVSMAVAIVLGATSMNDIALLAHHEPVFGAPPSDTTMRRTLELADPATLDKIARVRARAGAHIWSLIEARPAGFPWLATAWCRLLGLYDQEDLQDAEPDTLRYRLLSLPARLACHARARVLKISRTWPWKEAFLACWRRLSALPAPA
jgi:hypothetical protein